MLTDSSKLFEGNSSSWLSPDIVCTGKGVFELVIVVNKLEDIGVVGLFDVTDGELPVDETSFSL